VLLRRPGKIFLLVSLYLRISTKPSEYIRKPFLDQYSSYLGALI
jgi:hypothetical protein